MVDIIARTPEGFQPLPAAPVPAIVHITHHSTTYAFGDAVAPPDPWIMAFGAPQDVPGAAIQLANGRAGMGRAGRLVTVRISLSAFGPPGIAAVALDLLAGPPATGAPLPIPPPLVESVPGVLDPTVAAFVPFVFSPAAIFAADDEVNLVLNGASALGGGVGSGMIAVVAEWALS